MWTAAEGRETITATLTAEQQGDATRAAFEKDARVNRAAALKASGDARRAARSLRSGGAAPEEGEGERTGLEVGYGVFDAVYKTPADESPAVRYGRNYADKSRWTAEVAQDWEARLSGHRDEWAANNVTVRLFKVGWQGQELSRDALAKVLQQVLEPIGVVQGNLAVYSEMFDNTVNRGVQANEEEEVVGFGGGMYVPIVMKDLDYGCSQEKKAQMMELWGGAEPEMSEELGPGGGVQFWDCPAGYFIVGVPMLMADRREVVHNLCVQMSWYTPESLEEPERMDCLSGDWYIEGVDVRKREELQMVRLMAKLGDGIKLMLRPEWVDGVKLQMICGMGVKSTLVMKSKIMTLMDGGVYIEWKGEQRLLQTGKTDLLLVEKEKWSKGSGALSHRREREDTDHRKLVIKPLAKHCKGQACSDRMAKQLESWDGVEGVVSIGFSPDKHPEIARRGVVAFVVFETVEQRDAALVNEKVCYALLDIEFQLATPPRTL